MNNRKEKNLDRWLEEYLIKEKIISNTRLKEYKNEAISSKCLFHSIILKKNILKETELLNMFSAISFYEVVNIEDIEIPEHILNYIPRELIDKYKIIPYELNKSNKTFKIISSKPYDLILLDELKEKLKINIITVFALSTQIEKFLIDFDKDHDVNNLLEEMKLSISSHENEEENEQEDDSEDSAVVKLVNTILSKGAQYEASDIHIEPFENYARVRYRIDGVLTPDITIPKQLMGSIVSRIKFISTLNISERRRPQDGSFKITQKGTEIDVRTSIMNTVFGEKVVLRLNAKNLKLGGLDTLGFSKQESTVIKSFAKKPWGLILVTGPTGSGKTTTLLEILNYLNTTDKNIITIEDPVERKLPGIIHTQVNSKAEVTFATGLKSILRQDPDILMIGEIRDKETAEIAVQAAMTGHLVLSTIHTNDSSGAVTRLVDMGVDPFKISSCLVGVIAQRLVRTSCPNCSELVPLLEEERILLDSIDPIISSNIDAINRGKGCRKCKQTGYKGRHGVFELLTIDDDLRQLILKQASSTEIKMKAQEKDKFTTMAQNGMILIQKGLTTPEDFQRVIFAD